MNKKILSLILFSTLYITTISLAQTHNLKPNSICKYVKGKKNMEGMTACDACAEERKKNEAAIEKEVKKRIEANEIAKAENLKKIQQDYVKRSEANKRAIEEKSKNVVSFALPSSSGLTAAKPKEEKKATTANQGTVVYNSADGRQRRLDWYYSGNKLLNSKGEVVMEPGTMYDPLIGTRKEDSMLAFPPGIAIAGVKKGNTGRVYDIIDLKGNRHFNDDNINNIAHFSGPYFLVGYSQYASNQFLKAAIYNIENKTFQWIGDARADIDGRVCVNEIFSFESSFNAHEDPKYLEFIKAQGIKTYILMSRPGSGRRNVVYYINGNGELKKIYTYFSQGVARMD